MRLVVRTWNVFHGRTFPETRRLELERMIRLVTEDRPDVVALQEVPLWAIPRLPGWSGMNTRGARTKPSLLGPLGERLQRLDPVHVRSTLTGQANVLLTAPRLELDTPASAHRVNPGVRSERRVCQIVRVASPGSPLVIANAHLTTLNPPAALRELDRIAELLRGDGPAVLCGDFNLERAGLPGFSAPIGGIDQILVRGLELVRLPESWPDDRRRLGRVLLSDHAPIEAGLRLP